MCPSERRGGRPIIQRIASSEYRTDHVGEKMSRGKWALNTSLNLSNQVRMRKKEFSGREKFE